MSSLTPSLLDDVQREHTEIFRQMAAYNQAAIGGESRGRLLEIFDGLFERVREHFHAEETLLEQTSRQLYQPHHASHRQIEKELSAFRAKLAGNDPIDPVDCEHALDGLLIHHMIERPVFDNLYAHTEQGNKQWIWSGAWYRAQNRKEA